MKNAVENMINKAKKRPGYWWARLENLIEILLYKYWPPYRRKIDKDIDNEIGY